MPTWCSGPPGLQPSSLLACLGSQLNSRSSSWLLLNCFWWMFKTALLLDHCSSCSNAILWIWGVLMYVLITALLQLEAKSSSDSTSSATHPINNTTSAVFDRCTGLWGISLYMYILWSVHHSCTLIPTSETFLEYFWSLHLMVDHLKWLVYSCLDVWHMCTCRTVWLTVVFDNWGKQPE